jgi:glycosyltransferase involved in cell wall biosynthesis
MNITYVGSFYKLHHGFTKLIARRADAIIVHGDEMKKIMNEKLRKEMGENAYKKMKEDLSWDNIAKKTIEVYKKVINEHKNIRR